MSGFPVRRLTIALLASLIVLAAGARADDLDRQRAQREVAAQKLFDEVKTTLADARRLERTDPREAARMLRRCLNHVEDDTVLAEPQRTALQRQLRALCATSRKPIAPRQDRDAQARIAAEKRKLEAERKANPSSAADKAKELYDANKGKVAEASKLKSAKEAGFSGVVGSIADSAIPTEKNMTFASSYAYRAALRGKQKLTETERLLLKALNSVMSVDFTDKKSTFREALDEIMERTDQKVKIILDQESLKEKMVEYDDLVKFKAKKVTVRTILKKILADRGLTYIIKEGTIQVITPEKARESLVARSYPIGDLASSLDMRFNPILRRLQMLQNVAQLIDLMQNSIDPPSWQANGGLGTISFYEPTMSLVVRQTAEMHYQLGGSLSRTSGLPRKGSDPLNAGGLTPLLEGR